MLVLLASASVANAKQAKKHINIGTPKRNCVRLTWQYVITKYAESSILTKLADTKRTSMTNTYCVYTVLRYSWRWIVDLSETCRVLHQINLRNSASCRLLFIRTALVHLQKYYFLAMGNQCGPIPGQGSNFSLCYPHQGCFCGTSRSWSWQQN